MAREEEEDGFVVAGNRLTPLTEGPERLAALLRLIDGARESLRLLYYGYKDDEAGRVVRAALSAALARGVAVSLIVDGFGGAADGAFFAPLEAVGADICRFIPRFGRRYLLRNHQKLALADGERAIIGGFNIEEDYFAEVAPRAWRDFGLLVEGPAASRLAGYYDALAEWAHTPRGRMRDLRRGLAAWSEPAGPVRWLFGGPNRRLSPWARSIKRDLHDARRLEVIAAYFSPNPTMLRRMESVGRRGAARVITAAISDNTATIAAARHCYRRLLRANVEVYEYQPTKLHTKLYIVGDAVHVGSANFDMRSLFLNLELMLRIEDAEFAQAMRAHFDRELAQCRRITPKEHRAQSSWLNRLKWGLAYFFVAVLDSSVTRRLNFDLDA
jgi:cardiolipin synthase